MNRRLLAFGVVWATLLASCSAPAPGPAPHPPIPVVSEAAARPIAPRPKEPVPAPITVESYKKEFAQRVANASPGVFHDPLPKMFKSIVVMDVTIGHDGKLAHVSIRRSNGYKDLETVALNSVRHAAPFAAPSRAIRRSDGSVNFLETFMFRSDGRFQIRSLVDEA